MSLSDDLQVDLKKALIGKDELTLSVLRMVKAAISNKEIEKGKPQLTVAIRLSQRAERSKLELLAHRIA